MVSRRTTHERESRGAHATLRQSAQTDMHHHAGFGTIVGSSIAGKLMTREFIRYEQRYLATHPGAVPPSKSRKAFAPDFPMYVPFRHDSHPTPLLEPICLNFAPGL